MTAGSGHRRAAEALAQAAQQRCPGAEVLCVNLLEWVPRWLRYVYPRVYHWMVDKAPRFWAAGYYSLDHPVVFWLCRHGRWIWNRLTAHRMTQLVRTLRPEVVIATHFFAAEVFGYAKQSGCLAGRVVVVITDLFPHRLWLAPGVQAFVVGSEHTKRLCEQRGIEAARLHVLGIPIHARFKTTAARRQQLKAEAGLDPSRRTILISSGGMGLGPMEQLVRGFGALELHQPGRLQLMVVCGENAALVERLRAYASQRAMPIQVFEFVNTMPELMTISDVLVTKAGGLTIMEALAVELPMVFCGVIPGQEQFNAEHVVQQGAAVLTTTPEAAVDATVRILGDPARLEQMRERARRLGRPQAAEDIVDRFVCANGN